MSFRNPKFLVTLDLPCRDCFDAVLLECNKRHIMYIDTLYTRSHCAGEIWGQNRKQQATMQAWLASYLRAHHPDPHGDHYVTEED